MRYVIETIDEEMRIGAYIAKLEKDGKIRLIEKAEPLEVLKEQQHKIQRALELFKQAGINREVIIAYIQANVPSNMRSRKNIIKILNCQEQFYKALGIVFR